MKSRAGRLIPAEMENSMKAYNVYYQVENDGRYFVLENIKAENKRSAVNFCKHYIPLQTGRKVKWTATNFPTNIDQEIVDHLPAMTEEHKITLHANWIEHLKAYRIYFPYNPAQTVAYTDTIEEARKGAETRGYKVIEK